MRAIQLLSVFVLALTGTNTVKAALCSDRVSSGDKSIGITAVADASCASGGLGCFPYGDQCRFCRLPDSKVDHLELCSDVQVSPPSSTAPPTTRPEEETIDCPSLVSVGDQGVGISAVAATNPTCAANGLGCFQSGQCRFCQARATTQSAPYLKCTDVGESPESSIPSPTAASTSTTCSSVVTRSGLTGISYVSDNRCNVASPTLLGCSARTSCRLCRNYKNEANQYLISCKVLTDQAAATESVAAGSSSVDAASTDKLSVTTSTVSAGVSTASSAGGAVAVVAAVVAVLVVVMMSVMYVKGNRDSYDEPTTPLDDPDGGVLTPHGGRAYTPREGSLVMVVSQSSIATL